MGAEAPGLVTEVVLEAIVGQLVAIPLLVFLDALDPAISRLDADERDRVVVEQAFQRAFRELAREIDSHRIEFVLCRHVVRLSFDHEIIIVHSNAIRIVT